MKPEHTIDVAGVPVPLFLYGTAWKEDATRPLTEQAVNAGFRAIDTANQRRHYHEAGVGEAVRTLVEQGAVAREELFLQTKFTFLPGQDHRLPYDPEAPVRAQVFQSFESSQAHLGVDVIDAYILHGPSRRYGLGPADWEAWQAMEALHDAGQVRLLGVSNVSRDQLEVLLADARIPPVFVQNRCFARRGWDAAVRALCRDHDLRYQGFSLLTGNPEVLVDPALLEIASRYGRTPAQIVFRFALDVGMLPLTGTTKLAHMQRDLEVLDFRLDEDDVTLIERLSTTRC